MPCCHLAYFFSPFLSKASSLPAVKYKLEEILPPRPPPPAKTPWSPARRDTLDLSASLEHPPRLQHGQHRLLGTLLLTPAPKIVSEDDVAVNAGSFAGCTCLGSFAGCILSSWQRWPVVTRNEVLLVLCVSDRAQLCCPGALGAPALSQPVFPCRWSLEGSGRLLPWDSQAWPWGLIQGRSVHAWTWCHLIPLGTLISSYCKVVIQLVP